MSYTDNLQNIINRQKELLSELEAEHRALLRADLVKENAVLKAELEKLHADFEQAAGKNTTLTNENTNLRNALYEQIYNEKVKLINTSAQKLNVYFQAHVNGELNKLTAIENSAKARIDGIRKTLTDNKVDAMDDIYTRLDELSALLDVKITELRAEAAQVSGAFSPEELAELESLKKEQITDEKIRELTKKNNLERMVGLNAFNVIGIFLLVIGSIALAQFTAVFLSDLLKGIMLFALGGVLLSAGEMLNRKKPNTFSLGLSAGGVAILYAALAASYFSFYILDMSAAVVVCILVTAVAFLLSVRYNSQTITAFALIGGYLPIYTIGFDNAVTYSAMVYLVMLNLLALLISFQKKWRVSSYIGLSLNIIGTMYICSFFYVTGLMFDKVLVVLYVLFAFLIYTAIPIISTYRTSLKFVNSDVVFLSVNTFFSSLIMYGVFYGFGLSDYYGLLALAFAVIYLCLGRFVDKKFTAEERLVSTLFYLSGLGFVVLIIPLQFGLFWLSLGWLAEGTLLTVFGILTDEKRFRQVGGVISAMCLLAFLVVDCEITDHFLFVYKYSAITLGSIIILGAYMHRRMTSGDFTKAYKYVVMGNIWLYTMYLLLIKIWNVLFQLDGGDRVFNYYYLLGAVAVAATFSYAYIFPRIRLLSDQGTKKLSMALHVMGILYLTYLNAFVSPFEQTYLPAGSPGFGVMIAGALILIVFGVLSVFALRDLMTTIISERKIGVEWYPLVIAGYSVIILTQNLISHYGLSFASSAISIIYALSALAGIVFGFSRRYSLIRKFGLGLAMLAIVKLFLIDLAGLTQGYRIISYFALGISLVAISYVYQRFNKRLELLEESTGGAAHVAIDNGAGEASGEANGEASGEAAGEASEKVTGEASGEATGEASEKVTGETTEEATNEAAEDAIDKATEEATDNATDDKEN